MIKFNFSNTNLMAGPYFLRRPRARLHAHAHPRVRYPLRDCTDTHNGGYVDPALASAVEAAADETERGIEGAPGTHVAAAAAADQPQIRFRTPYSQTRAAAASPKCVADSVADIWVGSYRLTDFV